MKGESMSAWMHRIGSRVSLESRVCARLAGEINRQFRPVGLAALVKSMIREKPHPLSCECAKCVPYPEPELPMRRAIVPILPAKAQVAKKGFKQPVKKWDEVLGVAPDCTREQANKARLQLLARCHPDIPENEGGDAEQFAKIGEAFRIACELRTDW